MNKPYYKMWSGRLHSDFGFCIYRRYPSSALFGSLINLLLSDVTLVQQKDWFVHDFDE